MVSDLELMRRLEEMRVKGRDIYEVANQLEGWVGPGTEERLAKFLMREGQAASDLADEIVRLHAALAEAQKDRDYWKVEAEGERAKVEFRDKKLERYRLTNTEENDLSILAREIDVAARALKEKP